MILTAAHVARCEKHEKWKPQHGSFWQRARPTGISISSTSKDELWESRQGLICVFIEVVQELVAMTLVAASTTTTAERIEE